MAFMMELVTRFLIGGLVVSIFAMIGDALKPKSFAGLTGAAPSVALASLALTIFKDGRLYAATETQSMLLGAAAFLIYACVVARLLRKGERSVLVTTVCSLVIWLVCALGLWYMAINLNRGC